MVGWRSGQVDKLLRKTRGDKEMCVLKYSGKKEWEREIGRAHV